MNLLMIFFVLVAWTGMKGAITGDLNGTPVIVFPTFEPPTFDPIDLSGGCGDFVDCIEYLGAVIRNIGDGIIFVVLLLIELVTYVFELLALLVTVNFTGIEGAPSLVNVLLSTPFLAGMGIIIYRLVRSGESEA